MSSEPFVPLIRKGTALVIYDAPDSDVGSIGSNNIMGWQVRGCVGVVTNATARDTDEIITEKVPLYFRKPGRNEIESVNRPIVCGGVLVEPCDVIVADGDGVIVVPRATPKKWPNMPTRSSTATRLPAKPIQKARLALRRFSEIGIHAGTATELNIVKSRVRLWS